MDRSRRVSRNSRPNLLIQPIENSPESPRNDTKENRAVKLLSGSPLHLHSVKNLHQLRSLQLEASNEESEETARKLQNLEKLQWEKEDLRRSLEILKAGAVSAIAEKDQQIEKLKEGVDLSEIEKLEYLQREIQLCQVRIAEIAEEKRDLLQERELERERFLEELEERENTIAKLQTKNEEFKREMDKLEHSNGHKDLRIRTLQQENLNLSYQIEMSYMQSSSWKQIKDSEENTRNVQSYDFISHLEEEEKPQEESQLHKLYNMEQKHLLEIRELKDYYNRELADLREVYGEVFTPVSAVLPSGMDVASKGNLQTSRNDRLSNMRQNPRISIDQSLCKSNSLGQKNFEAFQDIGQLGSCSPIAMRRNCSVAAILSNDPNQMVPIDEEAEQDYDPKERILMNRLVDDIGNGRNRFDAISRCTRPEEMFALKLEDPEAGSQSDDINSQPTVKYLQLSKKKLRSTVQFDLASVKVIESNDEQPIKPQKKTFLNVAIETDIDVQIAQPSKSWKNELLLVLGMLAGGSFVSLIPLVFRR